MALRAYDKRRNELLDVAAELFSRDGYERTSVNAIIERAGISKGTFYHYFDSKEDVVNGLAERFTNELIEFAKAAVERAPKDAVARLNALFHSSARFKMERPGVLMALFKAMYEPGNLLVRERINRRSMDLVVPVLAGIVREGVEEGVFDVEWPDETAALLLDLLTGSGASVARLLMDGNAGPGAILRRYRCMEQAMARILGLSGGGIRLIDEKMSESLTALVKNSNAGGKAGGA